MNGFDQEIVQDFLTESGELLEQLDKDLVLLEQSPRDPDLLNRVFRALHTIKGSASFLQLTNLVSIAHAAESALNAARAGQVVVTKEMMDLLLAAVDVLKRQFEDLTAGRNLVKADDMLVQTLTLIGEGKMPTAGASAATESPAPQAATEAAVPHAPAPAASSDAALDEALTTHEVDSAPVAEVQRRPLQLPDNKAILVEFLITDLRETIAKAEQAAGLLASVDTRSAGSQQLAEHAEALLKSAQFFDFETMTRVCMSLNKAAMQSCAFNDESTAQFLPRVFAALAVLVEQTEGLASGQVVTRPVHGLCASMDAIAEGNNLTAQSVLSGKSSAAAALVADRVVAGETEIPGAARMPVFEFEIGAAVPAALDVAADVAPALSMPTDTEVLLTATAEVQQARSQEHFAAPAPVATPITTRTPAGTADPVSAPSAPSTPSAAQTASASSAPQGAPAKDAGSEGGTAAGGAAQVEQTIRVEVGRLEALLNLVGELVLQKNRLSAIARSAATASVGSQEFREGFSIAAGSLDRVTGDIQVAVMRTRMQPLDKLFGKYPRLIRDLSRKTGKDIRLEIIGGDTEVDKSVIEELGDPLVHIMRNSADHGIETPEQRKAAGKSAHGTITLAASHEGSHVQIRISDDGRGLNRDRIAKKAVERGLYTEAEIAKLSDRDVCQIIFAAGFSTAEKVTDLSGRGVGMDVVRTNIEKIKGSIELSSVEGKGTTITIKIPLTVAILTAMMVDIGTETYAVPLSNITEIVKPTKEQMSSVNGRPVLRLRETVLPLLGGCELFSLPEQKCKATPFAVIVQAGEKLCGLMVTRLIGQQEVVIKPLDGVVEQSGPVSGATVRDDGGVSLIVDVNQMVKLAEHAAESGWGGTSERTRTGKKELVGSM